MKEMDRLFGEELLGFGYRSLGDITRESPFFSTKIFAKKKITSP